jgi:hypothetical protein
MEGKIGEAVRSIRTLLTFTYVQSLAHQLVPQYMFARERFLRRTAYRLLEWTLGKPLHHYNERSLTYTTCTQALASRASTLRALLASGSPLAEEHA